MGNEEMRKRIEQMADFEILDIVNNNLDDYTPEATIMYLDELNKRKLQDLNFEVNAKTQKENIIQKRMKHKSKIVEYVGLALGIFLSKLFGLDYLYILLSLVGLLIVIWIINKVRNKFNNV